MAELGELGEPVASALVEVEVPRAIGFLRASRLLGEASAAVAAADAREMLRLFDLIEIDAPVRLRAAGPLGAPLRSLDAIHLASALRWREEHPNELLTVATHDERLARAAQAHGLTIVGWPEVNAGV
jgi:predicted nucleic acid-binding protein